MFNSRNYDGAECVLTTEAGSEVKVGDKFTDRFGDEWVVTGGQAPHTAASSGRIDVKHVVEGFERTFYPGVFNMQWVPW